MLQCRVSLTLDTPQYFPPPRLPTTQSIKRTDMYFPIFLATALALVGCTIAVPDAANCGCKKPACDAYCPDGTLYDCCVVYVRDPCADHQLPPSLTNTCTGPDDFRCICQCENGNGSYLCNVQYLIDPCKDPKGE